jgi:branched-chain amino acid transport system permease protein
VFGQVFVDAADLRMLVFGMALVLIMIFRPAGILPSMRRRRELGADAPVAAQEQASLYDAQR